MRDELLLSPEEICKAFCGDTYCQQEEEKFPCQRFDSYCSIAQAQHLRTIKGILRDIDGMAEATVQYLFDRRVIPNKGVSITIDVGNAIYAYFCQQWLIGLPKSKEEKQCQA